MLFTCGSNASGQLGRNGQDQNVPIQIQAWEGTDIQMEGGANHSVILVNHNLYGSGSNEFGQLSLEEKEYHQFTHIRSGIEFVSCGWNCTFISVDNGIFVVGENGYGQLGVEEKVVRKWQPVPVENIVKIKCGMRHSLFLSRDGTMYGCGLGKQGTLGRSESSCTPTLISKQVQDIACGQFHSAFIQHGNVYVMGRNKYNVLQNNTLKFSLDPILIPLPMNSDQVISGWHTIASIAMDGRVFIWGRNDRGQTGTLQKEPSEIPQLKGCIALQFGSEHGVALMPLHLVYVWGWNEHGNLGVGNLKDVFEPLLLPNHYRFIGCGAGHTLLYR
jgi:alpha-tubulin suppressor-like RCC1 family protein